MRPTKLTHLAAGVVAAVALHAADALAAPRYSWSPTPPPTQDTLATRIPPPPGFVRTPAPPGSWAEWLRGLPLKPAGAPVKLHTGAPKWRQADTSHHMAYVIDQILKMPRRS